MAGARLVTQAGFGLGLNLRDGPDAVEAAHAIDALNVIFRERGTLDVRPGSTLRRDLPSSNGEVQHVEGYEASNTGYVFVGYRAHQQAVVDAVGGSSASVANSGGMSAVATFYTMAKVGGVGTSRLYVASNGCLVTQVVGTTISTPAATVNGVAGNLGNGAVVGVTPWDSRLLLSGYWAGADGPGALSADRDIVYATDPADPLTLDADSFFRVGVGDGEDVMAIVSWREQVFIFKETCFWIMSGIGTDASGGPLFQRRPVEAGVGAASPSAVAVGRDGVYFLARNNKIYRTTGGAPQVVSDLVEPILNGLGSRYYSGGTVLRVDPLAPTVARHVQLRWHDELLYVNFQPDDDVARYRARQLVYDTRFGWWSLYDLPANSMGVANDGALLYADAGDVVPGDNYLWQLSDQAIGDANGIVSTMAQRPFFARWRSGWIDFGNPEVKVHAAVRAWGGGRPTLKVSRDFREFFESTRVLELGGNTEVWHDGSASLDRWGGGSGTDLWGPIAGVDGVMSMRAMTHSYLSYQLEGFVGLGQADPFSVHRLTHYVREFNVPDATRVHR